jgi:hypothetical protein
MKYYSRKASCHGGHCFYYMVKSSKFLINKYEDYEEKLKEGEKIKPSLEFLKFKRFVFNWSFFNRKLQTI